MNILVTGATGFIGRHLLKEIAQQHRVYALSRRTREETDGSVTWIHGDLAGPGDSLPLPGAVDAVVYLAQSKEYREFPEKALDNNYFCANRSRCQSVQYVAGEAASKHSRLAPSRRLHEGGPPPRILLPRSAPRGRLDQHSRRKVLSR